MEKDLINAQVMGIDIAVDYTQISYITSELKEPKSLSIIPGENKYLIPTLMYKMKNVDDWCIGDDAKHRSYEDDDERYVVRNLLERICNGNEMFLDDVKYTEIDLLRIYIEKLFKMAEELDGIKRPEYVTVTVEKNSKALMEAVYNVLNQLGYPEEKVSVIGHTESFIYYTLSQKRDIWANDVALFDFNNEHFSYRKLSIMRNKVPNIVTVKCVDYSEDIDMSYLGNDRDKRIADERMLEIIRNEFQKQIISSVFLTGVGFYSDFAENSLVELCSKRRVFKGYNLFVKGACMAAMEKCSKKLTTEYIYQCEGRTRVNIGLIINHEGRNTTVTLSKAGTSWYEAGARAECILDDVKSFQLVLSTPHDNCSKNVRIDLSDFPDRPNKTTRVAISLAYVNENKCELVAEDLGFGDFFKSTGVKVRETFLIDDIVNS